MLPVLLLVTLLATLIIAGFYPVQKIQCTAVLLHANDSQLPFVGYVWSTDFLHYR